MSRLQEGTLWLVVFCVLAILFADFMRDTRIASLEKRVTTLEPRK